MDKYETSSNSNTGLDDYLTLKVIGKGSYAKVLLVRKKMTQKIYALKVLKKTKVRERCQKEHVFSEKEILVRCSLHRFNHTIRS